MMSAHVFIINSTAVADDHQRSFWVLLCVTTTRPGSVLGFLEWTACRIPGERGFLLFSKLVFKLFFKNGASSSESYFWFYGRLYIRRISTLFSLLVLG